MRKSWAVLLFVILFVSLLATLPRPSTAQDAKWTFMVYMGADGNLESFGIDDFEEMAIVGSDADVKIVVQFDRIDGYTSDDGDWKTAKRFIVQKDMRPTAANQITDLGEVNMGDPQTLVDFMDWATDTYPADHYFLVLWGHGLGWQGLVRDDTSPGTEYLELDELEWAFQNMNLTKGGRKLDLLGADACRMTAEMYFQLDEYVRYFVGSQKDEPEPGWPYHTILENLTGEPDMGPAELGKTIVDNYILSYVDQTGLDVALSVVDGARVDHLGDELRRFVEQGRSALPLYVDVFKEARLATELFEGNSVYDLYDLFDEIIYPLRNVPKRLYDVVYDARVAVLSAVHHEGHWTPGSNDIEAHGISVWYPLGITNATYHDLDFCKETGWDQYLLDFYFAVNGDIPKPDVSLDITVTLGDMDDNGLDDLIQLDLESSEDGTLEIDVFRAPGLPSFPPDLSPEVIFLPASVPRMLIITVSEQTYVDLWFYLMNETRVWLNTSYELNVLMTPFQITGFVKDRKGNDISGAEVTVENLDTGETVTVESNSSGFTAHLTPFYTQSTIRVSVSYEDLASSTEFEWDYPATVKEVNFVLGTDSDSGNDVLFLLALLAILIVINIVMALYFFRRRGQEPVEKSGEELLREMKLE